MGIHDLAAAGFLQFLEKSTDRFSFSSSVCFTVGHLILYIFLRKRHCNFGEEGIGKHIFSVRASSCSRPCFSRPGAIRLPGLEKSGSFPFSANLESSTDLFLWGIPGRGSNWSFPWKSCCKGFPVRTLTVAWAPQI